MTLTELIKDNHVEFLSYRQGFFYYILRRSFIDPTKTTEEERNNPAPEVVNRLTIHEAYQFTIPADDIGTGTLRASMKAIECMRWIRKSMESGELIKL